MQTQRSEMRWVTAAVVTVLAVLTLAVPVSAVDIVDDPMQIDERATQLIQTSNSLCWEMHRHHMQKPDYREAYGAAKELWTQASQLRDGLRAGPVETEVLIQNAKQMNILFTQVEKSVSKWEPGDLSQVAANSGWRPRMIVAPGVEVEIPFVGIRVGGGQRVVTSDDNPPQFERRRLHPNSEGSKRNLERELAAVKVAMSYLLEDAGVTTSPNSPTTSATPDSGPVPPLAPKPDAGLGVPQKVAPSATKK